MKDTKYLERLIDAYTMNCNLLKDVKLSLLQKHIQGLDEVDFVIERQMRINKILISIIDEITKENSGLDYKITPFSIKKEDIVKRIIN